MVDGRLLEIFGPWQVQDYEPPTAENGIVPRNAYGNVELFKDCMLPKGTALIKCKWKHYFKHQFIYCIVWILI